MPHWSIVHTPEPLIKLTQAHVEFLTQYADLWAVVAKPAQAHPAALASRSPPPREASPTGASASGQWYGGEQARGDGVGPRLRGEWPRRRRNDRVGGEGPPGEAHLVDVMGHGLVPHVVLELLLARPQPIAIVFLGLVVSSELLVRPVGDSFVLVQGRRHRVHDVLVRHTLPPHRGARGVQGHGLLHALQVEAGFRDRVRGLRDLRVGLLDLALQASPHLLVLVNPVMHRALRARPCRVCNVFAAHCQLVVLVAERIGGGLVVAPRLLELRNPVVPERLVVGASGKGVWVLHGRRPAGHAGAVDRGAHRVLLDGLEAGLRGAEALLVDGEGLRLLVDIALYLRQLRLEPPQGALGVLRGVPQLLLRLEQCPPLVLERLLHDVEHVLPLRALLALLYAPQAEVQGSLQRTVRGLDLDQRLARLLDGVLQ
mmetsp:Transcript_57722/g.162795  ORF Transcript_57722/g.162795 Transcript_57722/m.162795 type:complete len:428 (+) Transcript_57722:60-1343(+)|eukprot:CAMPEP_0179251798 /NCGR_PEP_ID=MMETSP0797-20121207/21876_1 /TAXON_ID=47934 /ORGANISM="Dinophysis acuminata, Strain DAEP01" /LENGTH=427 /DNA_ID=CAMNT_0020959591 /DNA_START=59 /DNA_END=1342 /DNA_ORIENTATION=+